MCKRGGASLAFIDNGSFRTVLPKNCYLYTNSERRSNKILYLCDALLCNFRNSILMHLIYPAKMEDGMLRTVVSGW
jgi:hypothetical protein